MLRLSRYLKYYKKNIIIGPLFKWLEAVFELIVPLVMASIIDVGIKNQDKIYVVKMGGVMVLLGVFGLTFAIICQYVASLASQGVGTRMRDDLYAHINTLSHKELDQIGTSSLITRLTNDINQMQLVVATLIRLVVRAPFLLIGAALMAMLIDLKLAIIFIIAIPLIAVTLYFILAKTIPFFRIIQRKLDRVSLVTRENLVGIRVIRAFSKQEHERKRFEHEADKVAELGINAGKISALLNPINSVILNFAIIAVIWFGGIQVNIGRLQQGQIIAFVNYMTQILLALVVVADMVVLFTKGSASATRINEIFDLSSTIEDGTVTPAIKADAFKLEFRDVSISYTESDEYSLEGCTFGVNRGETIGIIGGTGSGKSTLVNLIPRLYDVSKGEILIDGINIKDYSLEELRAKVGIVPQNAVLFTGTIEENMQWGKADATKEEINRALQIANASEFVDQLPGGIRTHIYQGGKNLSGGQRQRLTIARAVVKNPEILILDDSSSALDFATDAALRQSIRTQLSGTTTFIVSQRATTIKNADKIVVLDDGQIAGIGTHQELLRECAIYKEICLSQLSAKEVAEHE